ncbi:fimbrial biogenesis chaperone [Sphingobium scionense]|uniref:Fimbrial chaperone protein n=1 Tax=Sphingobium scionense TaxID=1404341 RepID=A0A7W6PVS5_9SPHN|nr:fimbria/pilus periplasmic chaperone [Sphingobium scionense]MBB4147180.1 fimbrial chaperone protein [Sphingobium scionense]
MFLSRRTMLCGLVLGLSCTWPAAGSGLQVSPVLLKIVERSGVIWLINSTSQPIRAQIRVYRWSQAEAADKLIATEDVLASPPFVEIGGQQRQVVRLVRRSMAPAAASDCEQAFRLKIDELPDPRQPADANGLRYRLSYSVPVFLTTRSCGRTAPNLNWNLASRDRITVENSGGTHAQLSGAVVVQPDGRRDPIAPGLIGYVLPGSRMSFALRAFPGATLRGGNFEVMVNGRKVTRPLPRASSGQ